MIYDQHGYDQAVAAVMEMDMRELFEYLDTLYGRANLPRSCKIEDIRREALEQTERRFGPDYERFLLSRKNAFTAALVKGRGGDATKTEDDES